MDIQRLAELKSMGISHLYVAVAKADGIISTTEKHRAAYLAKQAHPLMNKLKVNKLVDERLTRDINKILADTSYQEWNAEQHLDEAISLLHRSREAGDYSVANILTNHIEGLKEMALLDEYEVKESNFIKKIKKMLTTLQ